MDISVIVPIYGVENYIEKSLRSLFSQTKTEGVEFILVNDQTKDRSMEVARALTLEYSHLNIVLIDMPQNGGVTAARQTGLDSSTGDYTIHFDPDDLCEPEMLEEMYAYAIKTNADVVIGDLYETRDGVDLYIVETVGINGNECIRNFLTDKLRCALWSKLIRRSVITQNNVCFVEGLDFYEDALFCAKVFASTDNIVHMPSAFIHYLQRGTSIVNNPDVYKRLPLIKVITELEKVCSTLQDNLSSELILLKIRFKIFILDTGNISIYDKYANLYPEIIPYIMSCKKYSFIRRVSVYLESKYNRGVGRVVYVILKKLRQLRDS